jgi:hypothetical protein
MLRHAEKYTSCDVARRGLEIDSRRGRRIIGLGANHIPIEIPEDILKTAGLTEADCLIELAVRLYAERRISIAQALRLSRMRRPTF